MRSRHTKRKITMPGKVAALQHSCYTLSQSGHTPELLTILLVNILLICLFVFPMNEFML